MAVLIILSILLNIFLIVPIILKYFSRYKNIRQYNHHINQSDIVNHVLNASLKINKPIMSFYEYSGLPTDYIQLLRPRGASIKYNFQTSYLLFGLTSYGIFSNNENVVKYVNSKLCKLLTNDGHISYPLFRIDQVPIGMSMILLNQYLGISAYDTAINQLLDFIIYRYKTDGRVLYLPESDVQHVDTIGMYIPFLCMLRQNNSNPLISEIINSGIEEYSRFGTDAVTHLPSHGYNLKSKRKIGSSNWGRGIGWYLLGLSFVDEFKDSILDKYVSELEYTQFPGQDSHFDSSTALMVEIYKRKKNLKSDSDMNFILPYMTKKGNVGSCSGDTYGYNCYSHSFDHSELCNGLFLYLATI